MVIVNHFMWFFYFSRLTNEARHAARRPYGNHSVPRIPNFGDIATFFGVCVWFIPVFLFLSLSANDNALPINSGMPVFRAMHSRYINILTTVTGHSSVPTTPTDPSKAFIPISTRPRGSLFRTLFDTMPRVRPRPSRRDTSEGLIAPRPVSPSPRSISPSPLQRPSVHLQRVPSMNNIPSPLPSPARRVASESDASEGTKFGSNEIESNIRIAPLRLRSPPRRSTATGTLSSEGRLEMRRK